MHLVHKQKHQTPKHRHICTFLHFTIFFTYWLYRLLSIHQKNGIDNYQIEFGFHHMKFSFKVLKDDIINEKIKSKIEKKKKTKKNNWST